jgi:hypothetical protein
MKLKIALSLFIIWCIAWIIFGVVYLSTSVLFGATMGFWLCYAIRSLIDIT